jgi:hypothetical protein
VTSVLRKRIDALEAALAHLSCTCWSVPALIVYLEAGEPVPERPPNKTCTAHGVTGVGLICLRLARGEPAPSIH